MRSSKSRSRSKSNRPRSIGNIVNRVFDSSGPEGKVRGTPQQIIEKYQFLARDAQLSNDRVAAENFMQHAEHYTRMLAEAQRELAAEQDQRRPQDYAQNGNQNGGQNGNQNGNYTNTNQNNSNQNYTNQNNPNQNTGNQGGPQGQNRDRQYRDDRPDPRDDQPDVNVPVRSASMMDFIDEIDDTGLVETPEARRNAPPRAEFTDRRDRAPKPDRADQPERQDRRPDRRDDRKPRAEQPPRVTEPAPQPAPEPVAAVTEAPAAAPRRARAPRKPRAEQTPGDGNSGPAEAAE